ncbi:MAG: hypothetical protein LBQ89_07535 [Treponema sp.]|nr:hypothetical protein [Treponema sp.]
MMNVKKFIALSVAAIVMLAVGCGSGPRPGTENTSARNAARVDVKWDDDATGYLTVQNDINEDLILFAGSINNRNILGGVRKLASRRVDFSGKFSEASGTFLLRAVKESEYRRKGSGLESDDIIFAGLVVFDKGDPRPINVNIQRYLGGNAVVTIQNDTNMALQIRVDRPDGPTLTTLAPFERNKKVYMDFNPRGYVFFPVYQYYDRTTQGIRSIMAQSLYDGIPALPELPGSNRDATIDFDSTPAGLFSPFATLIITNETRRGAILRQGSSVLTNQRGTQMFNPGSETYELDLQKQASLTIGGLSVDLNLGAANFIRVPDYTYRAEYTYQIRIREGGAAPVITEIGKSDTNNLSITLLNE